MDEGLAERINSNTPELLISLPQWVMWKYQHIAGKDKPKKPPFQTTGRAASVDDPRTWSSYDEVITALDSGNFQGIGFMLDGGIVAIDLDNCLTWIEGEEKPRITEQGRRVFELARSYTEISPSRKGLHIFLRGHLPEVNGQPLDGMKYGDCEMYERKRYITVTGERIGSRAEIRADQNAINQIYNLLKRPERERQPEPERKAYTLAATDAEVIRKAQAARNSYKFTSLYDGEIIGYRSKSEAHLALIAMLIYWTNGDAAQVDRLFKFSKMYRGDAELQDKWERKHRADGATYGQMTIEKAARTSRQL